MSLYTKTQIAVRCGVMLLVMFARFGECRVVENDGINTLLTQNSSLVKVQIIFPGTKWCGIGDKAKNYNDLGALKGVDKCCRAHDNCPNYIERKTTSEKYNLTNNRLYTSLSCDCDQEFYDCLKEVDTPGSHTVGDIYFNILDQQCFKLEPKIVKCLKYRTPLKKRCTEYELDDDSEEVYQWFDEPVF